MTEQQPRLVLDMDVFAGERRADAYLMCDGLFAALARSTRLHVRFAASAQNLTVVTEHLRGWQEPRSVSLIGARQPDSTEIMLSASDHPPRSWLDDPFALRAQVVGDLSLLLSPSIASDGVAWSAGAMLDTLDARTVIFAPTPADKTRLLEWRPDLSPAQITVIQAREWCESARKIEDALLDAWRRYAARPVSMLWQLPVSAPANSSFPASFLGYANGDSGPRFGLSRRVHSPEWPQWSDFLPASGLPRVEGGLRAKGLQKTGSLNEPLISYVTVVRNNVGTLGRAIESVQRQTYKNVEHIVVDGASSDGTVDLIVRHAEVLDYFVSESDQGLYDAINKAVPLARGDVICILNSDDWLEPHAAEIAVRRLKGRIGRPALLATGAVIYSLDGRVEVEWPPMFVHPGSFFACANVCHNGIHATRQAYECSGPYDNTFRIAADFKWVMACLDAGVDFVYTSEACINYSLGGTSGDAQGHSRECQRVISERFPFLTQQEVFQLYDIYFLFGLQPHDEIISDEKETQTMFLRRLFVQYSEKEDLLLALSWAAMTKLVHPADCPAVSAPEPIPAMPTDSSPPTSIAYLAKEIIKRVLIKYPRFYELARRGYGYLRE